MEPGAVPGVAPVLALLDRAVLERKPLVVGDGLGRDGDLGLQGRAFADDVMLDAVEDLADAGLVDVGVEVCHGELSWNQRRSTRIILAFRAECGKFQSRPMDEKGRVC